MALDTTNLSILKLAGTPEQQKHASRILPIRKNGHILLATLLLTNTVINETIPILFDNIFSKGFISVIVSTALLVLFAEIIPQSIFSKHGLAIGAMLVMPVKALIFIWMIISWPIAKLLDHMLGTHTGITYGPSEFGALVELHDKSKHEEGTLRHETADLLQNILSLQMNPIHQIRQFNNPMLLLSSSTVIHVDQIIEYMKEGQSHVVVYDKYDKEDASLLEKEYHVTGVISLKQLLLALVERNESQPIGELASKPFLTCSSTTPIIEVMYRLLKSKNKEQVVLIYRTEKDIKKIKEERLQKIQELNIKRQDGLNRHRRSIGCMSRRLVSSNCRTCGHLSSELLRSTSKSSFNQSVEEGTVCSDVSSSSKIDAEVELGLVGMMTGANILDQLSLDGPHLNFSHHPSNPV
ncbi:hypothetical protein A0J61_00359 [Choanephora cucurbitarum]|uniref:CNNM transmembrane domain-containing protein n=1 Tax=Choanephora cucurbitarum TaxID=101091 RepID=A0A1C7NR74_9FUNG|nr:hypothetical protein A0J61_00359 [Choanephora cucurbitarum]